MRTRYPPATYARFEITQFHLLELTNNSLLNQYIYAKKEILFQLSAALSAKITKNHAFADVSAQG
jgi:prophage maintenance system killer protein